MGLWTQKGLMVTPVQAGCLLARRKTIMTNRALLSPPPSVDFAKEFISNIYFESTATIIGEKQQGYFGLFQYGCPK